MTKSLKTLLVSGLTCLLLFLWSVSWPENFRDFLARFTSGTLDVFGDYYLYLGFGVVVLMILLAVLPVGKIKLGNSTPEYNRYAWIAMLFSTGMGPGLMLRAVQEPVYYYLNPPIETAYDPLSFSLAYTFFHWGLTPWAFYALFGLIVAYFIYVKHNRLLPSAILTKKETPAVGIDSLIILCTIIGSISAVGLGSRQLLEGFNYVSGSHVPIWGAILIVLFIATLSLISARSGLGKSIKYISTLNISISLLLLVFVMLNSNLKQYFGYLGDAVVIYLRDFIPMSLNIGKHQVNRQFLLDWTYFYWAFWLAWVPFTGVFIARISKGRSIREFVTGTLLAPTVGTFFWFTAFGQKAIFNVDASTLAVNYTSVYSAIFVFFKSLTVDIITNPLSLFLLFTFLITSIDSAIFVLSMFSDNGNEEPSQKHRLVWGLALGGLTAGLLIAGKESLLQATSQVLITIALPFSFLYLYYIFCFIKSLWRHDKR
ncbi:BCCT family transporter [Jiulongibacter sp. NS-SX5]|uniref:BCCT family transporter n=1 Tax=Jiulongibacter sp. NS-SX5 TaxID=3463854 RepID=UPI00405A2B25